MFTLVMLTIFVLMAATFAGLTFFMNCGGVIGLLGAGALGAGLYYAYKAKCEENAKKLELDLDDDDDNNKLLMEQFNKGVSDYNYLKNSLAFIKDRSLRREIANLAKTSSNIFSYLQRNPNKIPIARRFIDYYQDTAVKLIQKYVELEKTQLNSENIMELKQRAGDTLASLNCAFKDQFSKIISDQLMDMDAELKVMQQSMQSDGYSAKAQKVDDVQQTKQEEAVENDNNAFKDVVSKFEKYDKHLRPKKNDDYMELPPITQSSAMKRKLIAGALGVLFGGFGAHKFYLGKTGWGVFYLVFAWTGIPFIVGFIEGVRYIFMSVDEFIIKYCDNQYR